MIIIWYLGWLNKIKPIWFYIRIVKNLICFTKGTIKNSTIIISIGQNWLAEDAVHDSVIRLLIFWINLGRLEKFGWKKGRVMILLFMMTDRDGNFQIRVKGWSCNFTLVIVLEMRVKERVWDGWVHDLRIRSWCDHWLRSGWWQMGQEVMIIW